MNWIEENNTLHKEFVLESQTKLAAFFQCIAKRADAVNHHPDITVYKAFHLKISLTTHDKHALTEKDWQLAADIDSIWEEKNGNIL